MNPKWFLAGVFVLFVFFLAAVWILSERAHPVQLDEAGHPAASSFLRR